MKILMLFQTSPYPSDLGPSKRNTPFFLENAKRHEVSVLAFGTSEDEKGFRKQYGSSCKHIAFVNNKRPRLVNFFFRIVRFISGYSNDRWLYTRAFERTLQGLLRKEQFDLIHCCTPLFGYYQLPKDIPLIGDAHNVAHDFSKRTYQQERNPLLKLYYYIDYLYMTREEKEITDKFDVVIATTEVDRRKLAGMFPKKQFVVIPNGVELGFFEAQNVVEEPKTMVFAGMMSYQPNFQGIMYFLDEVFPLILRREPDAQVKVVGAMPPAGLRRRAAGNITVTGWVDDVKPYFARGQVFVIPLLVGGGIRGKALEAMAMKRPIVTTTLGCEGINLQHEDSALFADTPQEFADAVIRLFQDADLRKRLTDKAYSNLTEGYSWESNGLALENVYKSLVPSNGSSKSGMKEQEKFQNA